MVTSVSYKRQAKEEEEKKEVKRTFEKITIVCTT